MVNDKGFDEVLDEVLDEIMAEQAVEQSAQTSEGSGGGAGSPESSSRELAETRDAYLRVAAEYDNYRKRTAREREQLAGDVKAATAAVFLPVLDNLDRAAAQPTKDEAAAQGIEMIRRQMEEVLGKLGVQEMAALNTPFDPRYHDAVMHIEDENLGKNLVVEVFQKGYILGDRVLRHAVVKVAN